jgi:hypothetical protein
MPALELISKIRAKIKPARRLKELGWQTALRGHIERQRLFQPMANLSGLIGQSPPAASPMAGQDLVCLKLNPMCGFFAWINRGTQPCRVLFVLMDCKQP